MCAAHLVLSLGPGFRQSSLPGPFPRLRSTVVLAVIARVGSAAAISCNILAAARFATSCCGVLFTLEVWCRAFTNAAAGLLLLLSCVTLAPEASQRPDARLACSCQVAQRSEVSAAVHVRKLCLVLF
jgi:hypothetical protein